jgi:hypothetical protein
MALAIGHVPVHPAGKFGLGNGSSTKAEMERVFLQIPNAHLEELPPEVDKADTMSRKIIT